jgi:anthranilate synthase component 1
MIHPAYPEFARLARRHRSVPVFVECLADELTPMALFHARYAGSPSCFLLESVEGGERLGRYSFAAFEPERVARYTRGEMSLHSGRSVRRWKTADPLSDVRELVAERRTAGVAGLPRFFGGAVGYLGYDVVRTFERLPARVRDDLGLPEMSLFFTRDMYVFDHIAHTVKIARCVTLRRGESPAAAYRRAGAALRRLAGGLRPGVFAPRVFERPSLAPPPEDRAERRRFESAVRRAKRYIAAGDLIQVVLSRRVESRTKAHPLDIYRALRCVNPSPYMFFLRDGRNHIIGSSPEMLVRLEDRQAETRPIAGTRPRGADEARDERLAAELLADVKERAEHLMLVDLGRNDLGRVCRPGTVRVPDFMSVERYSHVMHLVSSVTGELEAGRDSFDLLRACFPAGTVSGAPKIRAMQVIDELEPVRRGPYAGAVGYFSYTGNMDMAITIRTVVLKGDRACVQAGAGIVADSVPSREYRETQNKAAAMRAAIRIAESGKI